MRVSLASWVLHWRMSWRYLLAHPAQLMLAVIGITTGVAAVISVDATRQLITQRFQQDVQQLQSDATHILERADLPITYEYFAGLRRAFPEIPMAPTAVHSAVVEWSNDTAQPVTVLAVDLIAEISLQDPSSQGSLSGFEQQLDLGKWLAGEAQILISHDLLPDHTYNTVSVVTDDGRFQAESIGVIPADLNVGSQTIVIDMALAYQWFPDNGISRLRLVLNEQQANRLNDYLDETWQLVPVNQNPTGIAAAFSMNMLAMGLLALLMGVLLVYSTFRLLLLQREQLHELQYVLGEGRRQIVSQLFIEAFIFGLSGTLLGLLVGLGLAQLVLSWLQQLLGELFATTGYSIWRIDGRLVGLSLVAGLGSSLLALVPLIVSGVTPSRMYAQSAGPVKQSSVWLAGMLMVCVLLGLAGWLLIACFTGLVTALAGLFAVTIACLLLALPALRWLGVGVQSMVSWRQWLPLVAARRLRTSVRRTTPALIALMLALATVVGVSSMVDSFRGSVDDWLDVTLSAEAYLINSGQDIPVSMVDAVAQDPRIDSTGWLHTQSTRLNDQRGELSVIDLPRQGQQSYRLLAGQNLWRVDSSGEIMAMLGETFAQREQIAVGDHLSVLIPASFYGAATNQTESVQVTIAGIFQDYRAGPGRVVILRDDWLAHALPLPNAPTSIGLYFGHHPDGSTALLTALDENLKARPDWLPGLQLTSTAVIKRETLRIFDQTFLMTRSLRWIVAIVALVGVCGALFALQLERSQELALLKTLGISHSEQRRLVVLESLLLGLLATVLAMPLGALLAWLLCEVVNLRAFGWHIETVITAGHWLLAVSIGVIASLVAAWLAGRQQRSDRQPGRYLHIYQLSLMVLSVMVLLSGCRQSDSESDDAAIALLSDTSVEGFKKVTRMREFHFPDDHGKHPGYRTEWWYVTGNLQAAAKQFGYQLTFFRYVTDPDENADGPWQSDAIWLAQVALTDIENQTFYQTELLNRELTDIAFSSATQLDVMVNGWRLWQPDNNEDAYRIAVETEQFGLQFNLQSVKPTVLQGDQGLSIKSADNPENASYYYSQTRLLTEGRIRINDTSHTVTGSSWLDREWSTSALSARQSGWDWFALQLDNQCELMFYQLRLDDGSPDAASAGVWVDAAGRVTPLNVKQVHLTPLAYWQSASNRARYPIRWQLDIPELSASFKINAAVPDQQWHGRFSYWEGAMKVTGRYQSEDITGVGYVELTGY